MAYQNYLVKVGSYTIPLSCIKTESYEVTNSTIDVDSYRNANGYLVRNAMEHKCAKVTFSTPPMYEAQIRKLFDNIKAQYKNATEKKCSVTCYIPEDGSYITQDMYVPDITFSIMSNSENGLIYNATKISFIAY